MNSGQIVGVVGGLREQGRDLFGIEPDTDALGMILASTGTSNRTAAIAATLDALAPLRALLWHVSDGGARPERVRNHLRALGQFPKCVEGNSLVQLTLKIGANQIFSDVGWVRADARDEVIRFLTRPSAHLDSATAYFDRQDQNRAIDWSTAALGLLWLWIDRTKSTPQSVARSDAEILYRVIDETVCAHGIAQLLIPSEDQGPLVWVVGDRSRMRSVKARLDASATPDWKLHLSDVSRLWSVGLVRTSRL